MAANQVMRSRARRWVFAAVLLPTLAWAIVVTAAQIVAAVRSSPTASQWLRDNASAVANLALRVESNGETTAYNGTCCYGVLQMNTSNIRAYTTMTPEQYRQADLQTQINAWVRLTDNALRAPAPRGLANMQVFDGRQVDSNLVLACVQLGIGNCQTMLDSGRCGGFADGNGTTICAMADRLAGATTPGTGSNTAGGTTPGTGTSTGSGTGTSIITTPCVRDGSGNCLSITASMEQGFAHGAGSTMGKVKGLVYALVAALVFTVMMASGMGLWKQYARGRLPTVNFILNAKTMAVVVMVVMSILTFM